MATYLTTYLTATFTATFTATLILPYLMSHITLEYSNNWKDLGSILLYQSNDFQFQPRVLITEFESCLIKKLSTKNLYHAIDPKSTIIYNDDFIHKLKQDVKDLSIVVISNQCNNSKLNIDMIKRKFEDFISHVKIPILALFVLKHNRLSKPHTGTWQFLKAFYASKGNAKIHKACVISDFGGRIMEQVKKNGDIRIKTDNSDMDRAFANNIDVPFYTIEEYLNPEKKERFTWNSICISPELRQLYIEKLSQYKNPNIFAKLAEKGPSESYMIMIYGAPCSGKTTLAKELLHKWRNSEYGKTRALKRFGLDKYGKSQRIRLVTKAIADRISVIIDGDCHSAILRKPFEEIAAKFNTPILYVEINPGIGFAYILNHVAIETTQDEKLLLHDDKKYYIYKSEYSKPPNVLLYCPNIKQTKQIMQYRY